MRGLNWRTGAGHVARWSLVAATVVVLHAVAVRLDVPAVVYGPASVATTHVGVGHDR